MKILLADDEYLVLEVLKKIIKWDELGLTLAGIATNGEDAYKQIVEKKPDIVISDIRMPLVDGLELVKKCADNPGPAPVFIIISGYKHFDYALSALKYGVKDYLLKPINASELNTVLQKAVCACREAKEARQTAHADVAPEDIRGLFLPTLLSGTLDLSDPEPVNRQYMTRFAQEGYSVVIIHTDRFSEDSSEGALEGQKNIFSEIRDQTVRNVSLCCCEVLETIRRQQVILLVNYDIRHFLQIKKQLVASLDGAIKILGRYCRPMVTFGLGSCRGFPQLGQAVQRAEQAVQDRLVRGVNHVIEVESSSEAEPCTLDGAVRKQLTAQVESLDLQSFAETVKKLFAAWSGNRPATSQPYWNLCQSIYSQFWDIAGRIGDPEMGVPDFSEIREELMGCVTPSEMCRHLLKHTSERFSSYYDVSAGGGNSAVAIVKKYITKYYAQKITLEDAGAMVYLNPVYFSILFKKETGVNFSFYLNEYRIEMSKQFLRQIKYSVTDVALKVGFSSARYYAKQFKKYVGITPTEYRNIHISDATPIP
ncbi:MAG TPA: hypothetical protein DF613_14185 [Lachnospiraceae bacterium]|nr:hypothetical protein [Lachnospiraceae bacterium]